MKLLPDLHTEEFSRGEVVYKQGQPCLKVYIVFEGEFQAEIHEAVEKERKFNHEAYTGPKHLRAKTFVNAIEARKNINHTNLAIYSRGMMMGVEEIAC